jgi:hypothetical protein
MGLVIVTGDAVEAYDEPRTELGLRGGGGGGTEAFGTGVCDTVSNDCERK